MSRLYFVLGMFFFVSPSSQDDSAIRPPVSIQAAGITCAQDSVNAGMDESSSSDLLNSPDVNPAPIVSGLPTADTAASPDATIAPPSGERESVTRFGGDWSHVYLAMLCLAMAAAVTFVKNPIRPYLGAAFAVCLVLFLVPRLGFSSVGLVGLLSCLGILIHFLVPKSIAEKSVILGIGLAFFAYAFAVAGSLAAHAELDFLDRYSTAFYEATQLPLMNMSPHVGESTSESRFFFMLARIFGCLFAYFLAYKAVSFVCGRARSELLLGWYALHSRKKLALVIGIGTIGRRLIRNLLAEGYRVIAIEADKDSIHIERAQSLGAVVVVGDALDDPVYDKIPFDAIGSIYVVAGDDRTNLEISHQLLTYSIRQVQQLEVAKSPESPWWKQTLTYLRGLVLRNEFAVCHVQLYDSNMRAWMEKEYFTQQVQLSHIEMRYFNAQQNAVRDLVQRELTKPGIRPDHENEVALYFIVGLEELGQEVAIGIAQLAHFANLKRSRIVVLCKDPNSEASAFLARYPKFTASDSIQVDWKKVAFKSELDNWDITAGVQKSDPPESSTGSQPTAEGKPESNTEGKPAGEQDAGPINSSTESQSAAEGKTEDEPAAKQAVIPLETSTESQPTAEDASEPAEENADKSAAQPESQARILRATGVEFATNTIFTRMPASPCDPLFLELVNRLTKEESGIAIKPSVIVCDKDVNRSFQWSSEFAEAWKQFAKRNRLKPECADGTAHPSLTTYFWLRGHKSLREIAKDNVRHVPFGLEENCISTTLLDATLLRKLAAVVEHSYHLCSSSPQNAPKPTGQLESLKFEFLKSNLFAAAHSLIKFQIAGGRLESILTKGDVGLPKIEQVKSFQMDGVEYCEPPKDEDVACSLLTILGKMEHNRWMAEQLLKGYEFVEQEADKVNGKRLPQHEHQRKTLCDWKYLDLKERNKDLRQAYYVLYQLHSLSTLNSAGS